MKLEELRELAEARERNKHEDPSDDGERFEGAMDRHADALLILLETAHEIMEDGHQVNCAVFKADGCSGCSCGHDLLIADFAKLEAIK